MFKNRSLKFKITIVTLAIVFFTIIYNYGIIHYGIIQGIGQLKIITQSQPINTILKNPDIPDSIKNRILFIQEIKKFAFDSLKINKINSYTDYYEQNNKPILWTITACDAFQFRPYTWNFPFIGEVTYKGFFDYNKALNEGNDLKKQGYDIEIGEVSAWSTLGWLDDPILSSMLKKKDGALANLIIHELTHGTLYAPSSVTFNENLANFIGHHGALRFLKQKYPNDSTEIKRYLKNIQFQQDYANKMLAFKDTLKNAYSQIRPSWSFEEKRQLKDSLFNHIKTQTASYLKLNSKPDSIIEKVTNKMNNAYFVDYVAYDSMQEEFTKTLNDSCQGDIVIFFEKMKKKYLK